MQYHIDQEGDERVGGGICLFAVLQQAENDLATIQNTNDLVSGSAVTIYLRNF
jgi:hypothetical protein